MDRTNDLIVNANPKSRFAESVKTIRTNLAFGGIDHELKVILNTSCEPGDGKSFISANLAIAYAQEGKKVLIIDCDLRRGIQTKIFGIEKYRSKGYSHLILNYKEDMDIKKYFVKTKINGVTLLPSGIYPPNPVELLGSKNNEALLEQIKSEFDIVILDCPPVLGLNDSLVMTKYSDANILIVTNKKTKMENLEEAKKAFTQVNATISGVIINKVQTTKKDTKYYYYA